MKNIITLFLTLAVIALTAVGIAQWRKLTEQKAQLLSLNRELEQKSQQLTDLQRRQKRVEAQRDELSRRFDELQPQAQTQQSAVAVSVSVATNTVAESGKPDGDKAGFGKFLSRMMEDPETRAFIREQQRLMVNQLYGPLIQQLGLTPEEAKKFKELLLDNQMKGAERAGSLFGGGFSTNQTEAINALSAAQKEFDEQMKAFLGDARYAQYTDYQQTLQERTQLSLFRQQNPSGQDALNDQQVEQLLTIMAEEKKNVAAAIGEPLAGTGQDEADVQAMLSGDAMEKLLQAQENVNQRVYERARGVLSQAQLEAFGQFQTNQLQMMRMGISMARKLFGPDKTANEAAQPNQ